MSSRAQSTDSVPTKKGRVSAARKEAVPRAPRGGKKPAGTARVPGAQRGKSAASSPAKPAAAPDTSVDDIDKLTAGMKKIRINLITKSQKERDRLGAQKAALPSASASQPVRPTPRQSSSPKIKVEPEIQSEITVASPFDEPELAPTHLPPPDAHVPTPPTTVPSSGFVTPILPQTPFDSSSPAPHQFALPASSPPLPSATKQPDGDPSEVFIPYQPEGPTPVAVAQHESLQWLPPNVPTPSANTPAATPSATKPSSLFHYAGGSGIPFAPRPQESGQGPDGTSQ